MKKNLPAGITLVVLGAGGRMGQAVLDEAEREQRVAAMLAVFSPHSQEPREHPREHKREVSRWSKARVAKDAAAAFGEVVACGGAAIDFTTPESSAKNARMAAVAGCPFVCGTTGLSAQEMASLRAASTDCAVVYAANFSLGVALVSALVERAASLLSGEEFDAEIFEMHHRDKKDAPSGTALRLGEAVARGRGEKTKESPKDSRGESHSEPRCERKGARACGEVGYGVLRGGGIVGEHRVMFAGKDERITLGHEAFSRALFATGAVKAALWACVQKSGFYSVDDVLECIHQKN